MAARRTGAAKAKAAGISVKSVMMATPLCELDGRHNGHEQEGERRGRSDCAKVVDAWE